MRRTENHFDISPGTVPSPVATFVIHHTGRYGKAGSKGGDADSVIETFKERGYPAQFIIDRQGKIYQYMPLGAFAWHAAGSNSYSMGVEVISDSDSEIAKDSKTNGQAQLIAAARLAKYLGFRRDQIVGHGAIANGNKDWDEGKTITDYINSLK